MRESFTDLMNLGFPGGSVVKNLPANAGDMGPNPGVGKIPCLENPTDRGAMGSQRVGHD